jgi:hypothetical protein
MNFSAVTHLLENSNSEVGMHVLQMNSENGAAFVVHVRVMNVFSTF